MTVILLHSFTKRWNGSIQRVREIWDGSLKRKRRAIATSAPRKSKFFCRPYRFALLFCLTVLITLMGCSRSPQRATDWKIYANDRYGFEFPYPSDWVAAPMPTNDDGQAFTDPSNPNVEIRGWASQISAATGESLAQTASDATSRMKMNFVTEQGLAGALEIKVSLEESSVSLSLRRDEILYGWQGRSPSDQFADYYKFFTYVASQYRIK